MAKRKSVKNELKDFFFQSVYSVILAEGVSILLWYGGYKYDPIPPAVLAINLISVNKLGVFNRRPSPGISFGISSIQSNRPGLLASIVRWSNTGVYDSRRGDDDYIGRKIRYKEPQPEQLFWDVQLSNRLQPIRIFEDDLHRFVSKVSRRQRSGLSPFSRNFFRREFGEPEYNAMVQVLSQCGLVQNRGQGASGRLSVVTPYAAMWQVKTTYTALLD